MKIVNGLLNFKDNKEYLININETIRLKSEKEDVKSIHEKTNYNRPKNLLIINKNFLNIAEFHMQILFLNILYGNRYDKYTIPIIYSAYKGLCGRKTAISDLAVTKNHYSITNSKNTKKTIRYYTKEK